MKNGRLLFAKIVQFFFFLINSTIMYFSKKNIIKKNNKMMDFDLPPLTIQQLQYIIIEYKG